MKTVSIIRATDLSIVSCWWDDDGEWFSIRSINPDHNAAAQIKTIRISRKEAIDLQQLINTKP